MTDVPIRSSTLDAIGAAEWHLSHLRTALEHELAAVYAEIDRLRGEVARLRVLDNQSIRWPEQGWWEEKR